MATLTITKSISSNNYVVQFAMSAIAQSDLDLFTLYGNPVIQMGATIPVAATEVDDFYLNTATWMLEEDGSYEQRFDGSQDGAAAIKALAFIEEIKTRITNAFTELRARTDTFSGTETLVI